MSNQSLIKNIDILQLEDAIEKESMVVVDFWAKWCNPCHAFAEVFTKVASEEKGICFLKMDVGEATPEVMDSLGIQSIPHLMIFKKGQAVYSESGTLPYTVFKELITQTRELELD